MKEELFDEYETDDFDNIITLSDEQGNAVNFEFLDMIEYAGEEYFVLAPANDEEAPEVVILKVKELGDGEEEYVSVEDQDTLDAVFEIFKEKFKDEFNFVD